LQNTYPYPLDIELDLKQNNSIHVRNIPKQFDKDDLKEIFTGCIDIQLLYNMIDDQLKIPDGIVDDICQIFSGYRSFKRQSIQIQPTINNGRVEAFVQLTDSQEVQLAIENMNGKTGFIGAGKIRLSIYEQEQNAVEKKSSRNDYKDTEFTIHLSRLPPNVYEEVLDQVLNQHQLGDYVTNLSVFRKKLSLKKSSSVVAEADTSSIMDRAILQSLVSSRKDFHSEPDIQIFAATSDGRGSASIIFNDPRDVMTVMNMYGKQNNSDQLKLEEYTLHLIPNLDHTIELNASLARAIPHEIQQVIDKIKSDVTLSDITLCKKMIIKGDEEMSCIVIKGIDIQQITRARIIFHNLMKGLQFKFHLPSWVSIIFVSL
jgi:RNA recognition motif-containing protein